MAIKKIETIDEIEEEALTGPLQAEDEPSDDIALAASLALLGENQGDAKVIVYQIDEKTKKDIFLYDCTVTEFSNGGLKEIQERYGKGEYRIRVYAQGRGVLTHRRISIGECRVMPQIIPTAQAIPNIELILANQTQMMANTMKELAVMLRPADNSKGMLEMIIALKPLLMPQQIQQQNSDPLEMLSKLLDIQNKISPKTNADGEVGAGQIMLSAMETFGKPLAEMMAVSKANNITQNPKQNIAQNPVENIAQNPALIADNTITQKPENIEMNETQMKATLIRPTLMLMASNDADVYPYACMSLDMFSDEEIEKYIDAPDWWKQLLTLLPGAEQYEPWFAKLRATVKDLLAEEKNDSVEATENPTEQMK